MNPLTKYILDSMESQRQWREDQEDRVAKFSVQAQKIHDERNGPSIQAEHWRMNEKQVVDFNCYNYANSAQKMTDAGVANSFKAFRYYQGEAEKKRDKLLKEVASA